MNAEIEIKRPELMYVSGIHGMGCHQFMDEIDRTGGWPIGCKYVSFYCALGENRWCKFGNKNLRTGWWTTVASADDYYWWKLSDEKKAEVTKAARNQLIRQLR